MGNLYELEHFQNTTGTIFGKPLTQVTNLTDKLSQISKMKPGSLMNVPVGQITAGMSRLGGSIGSLPINNFASSIGSLPEKIGSLPIEKAVQSLSSLPQGLPLNQLGFPQAGGVLNNLPVNQLKTTLSNFGSVSGIMGNISSQHLSGAVFQLSNTIARLPIQNVANAISQLPIEQLQNVMNRLPLEELKNLGVTINSLSRLAQGDIGNVVKQLGMAKLQGVINQLPVAQLNNIMSKIPGNILGSIPTNNITGALAQLSAVSGLNFGALAGSMSATGIPGIPGSSIGMLESCGIGGGGYGQSSPEGSYTAESARYNTVLKSGGPPGSGNVVNNGRGTPHPMLADLLTSAAKATQVDVSIFSLDRAVSTKNRGNHLDGMAADVRLTDGNRSPIKSNHEKMKNFVDFLMAKQKKVRIGAGRTYMGGDLHVDITAITKGRPATSWGDGLSWQGRIGWLVELDKKYGRR